MCYALCIVYYRPGGFFVSLTYNGDAQLDLKQRALTFGSLAASVVIGAVCIQFVRPNRSLRTPPDSGTPTPTPGESAFRCRHCSFLYFPFLYSLNYTLLYSTL